MREPAHMCMAVQVSAARVRSPAAWFAAYRHIPFAVPRLRRSSTAQDARWRAEKPSGGYASCCPAGGSGLTHALLRGCGI